MSYGNRKGIGRFGMGMKTAALSISPVMELYSWQEAAAFYGMTLDTDAIGRDRSNLVPLPEPSFNSILPEPVLDMQKVLLEMLNGPSFFSTAMPMARFCAVSTLLTVMLALSVSKWMPWVWL